MKKLLSSMLITLNFLLMAASPSLSQTNRNRPKPVTKPSPSPAQTRELGQPQKTQPEPARVEPVTVTPKATAPAPAPPVSNRKKKVMVTDFDARGIPQWWGTWDIGSLFANVMISQLSRTDMYDVVERSRMMDVIQEQNLTQDERFRQDKVTKIGQLLGADYIVFGYLTNFSRKKSSKFVFNEYSAAISYSVRLVEISSAKVVKSAEIEYVSDKNRKMVMNGDKEFNPNDPDFLQSLFGKAINESVTQAVQRLTGEQTTNAYPVQAQSLAPQKSSSSGSGGGGGSGMTVAAAPPVNDGKLRGTIAAVDGDTVIINRGQSHGVKVGDVFEVTRGGIVDPETGRILRAKVIAEIKVTNVESESADGTITTRKEKEKIAAKDPIVLKN